MQPIKKSKEFYWKQSQMHSSECKFFYDMVDVEKVPNISHTFSGFMGVVSYLKTYCFGKNRED